MDEPGRQAGRGCGRCNYSTTTSSLKRETRYWEDEISSSAVRVSAGYAISIGTIWVPYLCTNILTRDFVTVGEPLSLSQLQVPPKCNTPTASATQDILFWVQLFLPPHPYTHGWWVDRMGYALGRRASKDQPILFTDPLFSRKVEPRSL